jgi:ankyrin repeat protein
MASEDLIVLCREAYDDQRDSGPSKARRGSPDPKGGARSTIEAMYFKKVASLCERGADVNQQDYDHETEGITPLLTFAEKGWDTIVGLLLEHSAKVDFMDRTGHTALHCAAREGHHDCIRLLLEHGREALKQVNVRTNAGETALMFASSKGHAEAVEQLLGSQADANLTTSKGHASLTLAALHGHAPCVRLLLKHVPAVNVDLQSAANDTALTLASWKGFAPIVGQLLAAKANTELTTQKGSTALTLAAANGHGACVQLLLEHDPMVNLNFQKVSSGATALTLAAEKGHAAIVGQLLAAKAHTEQANLDGHSALTLAAVYGRDECVKQLLVHSPSVNVNFQTGSEDTALTLALWKGFANIVAQLLAAKAETELITKKGNAPLTLAAREGHDSCVKLLLQHEPRVNVNIQMGHEVGGAAHENGSKTALMLAAENNHQATVRMLLEAGADTMLRSDEGQTAQELAKKEGNMLISQLIQTRQKLNARRMAQQSQKATDTQGKHAAAQDAKAAEAAARALLEEEEQQEQQGGSGKSRRRGGKGKKKGKATGGSAEPPAAPSATSGAQASDSLALGVVDAEEAVLAVEEETPMPAAAAADSDDDDCSDGDGDDAAAAERQRKSQVRMERNLARRREKEEAEARSVLEQLKDLMLVSRDPSELEKVLKAAEKHAAALPALERALPAAEDRLRSLKLGTTSAEPQRVTSVPTPARPGAAPPVAAVAAPVLPTPAISAVVTMPTRPPTLPAAAIPSVAAQPEVVQVAPSMAQTHAPARVKSVAELVAAEVEAAEAAEGPYVGPGLPPPRPPGPIGPPRPPAAAGSIGAIGASSGFPFGPGLPPPPNRTRFLGPNQVKAELLPAGLPPPPGPFGGGRGGGGLPAPGGRGAHGGRGRAPTPVTGMLMGETHSEEERLRIQLQEMQRQFREQQEQVLCVVCFESKRSHVLLPCFHKCLCGGCADALMASALPEAPAVCPMCRAAVIQAQRIFE